MKLSNETMKKLGFVKYGDWWEHKNHRKIKFHMTPDYSRIVNEIVKCGYEEGERDAKYKIKQALGI